MTRPKLDKTVVRVVVDQLLLDEVDVECEILTVGRGLAIAEGLRLWLAKVRTAQLG